MNGCAAVAVLPSNTVLTVEAEVTFKKVPVKPADEKYASLNVILCAPVPVRLKFSIPVRLGSAPKFIVTEAEAL